MKEKETGAAGSPKILFVFNSKSGNSNDESLPEMIVQHSQNDGFAYEIYHMKANDESGIRSAISKYSPEIVAAVGGDGTVKLLAEILCSTPIKLAIIPFGSANGMAKELNIGNRLDTALEILTEHDLKQIDLIRINNEVCIHLADIGLNARVVKRFESDKKRGLLTYAKHLFGEIFLLKHYRFNIIHDDQKHRVKAVSVTFANASKYGTGAVINPEGVLDDGLFELVIVKPFPNVQLFSIAWKMFNNRLHKSDYVEIIKCQKATVFVSHKTTLQIDGEVIGKVREIKCEIVPKALTVLVPKSA